MLETDAAFIAALEEGALDSLAITPTFFGMLGGQGALPLRYTEIVAERESLWRDRAARAFFDIFSNRATALFYLALTSLLALLGRELERRWQARS